MAATIALEALATVLDIPQESVVESASFISYGGDSFTVLRLAAECKRRGVLLTVDDILSSKSVGQFLRQSRPFVSGSDKQSVSTTLATLHTKSGQGLRENDDNALKAPVAIQKDNAVYSSTVRGDLELPSDETTAAPELPSPEMVPRDAESYIHDKNTVHPDPISAPHHSINEFFLVSAESEELCGINGAERVMVDLSEGQVSLVHGSLEVPGANVIHYFETYRPSQISQMKQAWKRVLQLEPIFTTRYRSPEDGCLLAPVLHWREYKTDNVQAYEAALSAVPRGLLPWQDAHSGVDLAVRFTIVHLQAASNSDCRSTIIWSVHHALIDGWSASQVLRKVHSSATGRNIEAGPPFTKLSKALDEYRLSNKAESDNFWAERQEKLATARDELLLPAPAISSNVPENNEIRVNIGHHFDLLKASARSWGITPAAFYHAAWALLLGLYTDSDNVVFGTVVSGRNLPLPGIFDTVGPMVNTLPLQIDIDWTCSARDLVRDVFDRMQTLTRYSWTAPDKGLSRVAGTLVAMQPDTNQREKSGIEQVGQAFSRQTTNLPLSAIVTDDGEIIIQYNARRYHHSHMQGVAKALKCSLIALCNTDRTLESCATELLSVSTIERLRFMGNCESSATTKASVTDDLVTLFERVATKHPQAIAIERGETKVTYSELEALSGHLAHTLSSLIGPEEVVAVHADGSVNWLVSIYAILRAGGTYCPIDQAYPQPYREALFESSTAKYFIATTTEALAFKPTNAVSVLDVSVLVDIAGEPKPVHKCPLRARPRPWERAYLCFSSGTTGRPKGIICTHQGLVAFQRDVEVRLFATVGVRVAQVMSVAFDGSIHELFSALSYGATLVLRQPGDAFGHLKTVDSAILTPSIASMLDAAEFPRLQTVYLVGEAVPQAVCDAWAAHKALYNMYGPTESTCGATIKRLYPNQPVTIGGPNSSTRIYVLDHRRRLVPVGRIGELYLAGVQVAQGYLGRPELNIERFLPDSICSGLGELMFKTGDRGHWNEAGEVVFLGRADRQIKLRGYRLDLEDVEARILRACPAARAVAITRKGDELACMVQTTAADVAEVRAAIGKALPAYAVPRYIALADKLPITSTGKVDYGAVAAAATAARSSHKKEDRFETETEAIVAATWNRVLQAVPCGVTIGPLSNFTQLGGHSLQQLRVAAKLTSVFGERITVRMINELATLRDLAGAIDKMTKRVDRPATQTRTLGQYELSPMEAVWWRKYQLDQSSSAFNVSYVAKFNPEAVDRMKLIDAWNTILSRHDIFRTRYVENRRYGLHRVLAPCPPRVERLRSITVELELNRPFKLADSPPVRVMITRDTMIATWSHIICDYTTLGLVLNEVAAVYHEQQLDPIVQPYCQGVATDIASVPCYLSFWSEYLRGAIACRASYLGNGGERTSYRGTSAVSRISSSFWRRMQTRVAASKTTLQQLAVAAVALALTAADEDMDITLGTPFINRQSEADMHTVGLFLEPLPVRVAFSDQPALHNKDTMEEHTDVAYQPRPDSLNAYLRAVQASSQRSLSHAIPWHHLLDHLQVDAQGYLPNHPLFDCVVSFHDARHGDSSPPAGEKEAGPVSMFAFGDDVQPQLVWSEGAKFKLMVEFLAVDQDTLILRLEYDTTCYESPERIAAVRRMIMRALQAIIEENEQQPDLFTNLRKSLHASWNSELASNFDVVSGRDIDDTLLDSRRSFFQVGFSELRQHAAL